MGMDDQVVLTSFVNEMDAQVLVMELEGAGIEAFIQKDDCGGMRPFITAERGIEVLVFRKDLARAQEVMGKPETAVKPPPDRSKGAGCFSLLIAVLISFAAGVSVVYLFNSIKYGGSRFVAFTYFLDRNNDGEDDFEVQYDVHGAYIGGRADENFDGTWDSWWSNEYDVIKSCRKDTDFNGVADCYMTYDEGVISLTDWMPNGKQSIRRDFFKDGVLQSELVDTDRDGSFDLRISYDPFMNETGRTAL